jgi:hypothetical protein
MEVTVRMLSWVDRCGVVVKVVVVVVVLLMEPGRPAIRPTRVGRDVTGA